MRNVTIKNKELLSVLNEYSDLVYNLDLSKIGYEQYWRNANNVDEAVSVECLEKTKLDSKHEGFPLDSFGYDFLFTSQYKFTHLYEEFEEYKTRINEVLGSKFSSLMMVYPPNGFIGWHTNENCHGYNIILSYSLKGNGFFRYQDPKTKEIITLNDPVGWSAKAGYFGFKEEDIFWHTARGFEEHRLTCSFVLPHKGMWESMIEDIEND